MADVIHTREVRDVDDSSGPAASMIALMVLIVLLLLLGAWWLFWSGASPLGNDTTIIAPETEQVVPNQTVPAPGGDTNIDQSETDINVAPGAETTTN